MSSYAALETPSQGLIQAFRDLYSPGVAALRGSGGREEAEHLLDALAALEKAVVKLRRVLKDDYRLNEAISEVKEFGVALTQLTGALVADTLLPDVTPAGSNDDWVEASAVHQRLLDVRVDAALTLATAMPKAPLVRALELRLPEWRGLAQYLAQEPRPPTPVHTSYIREVLYLMHVGTRAHPWPLDDDAAARNTLWPTCTEGHAAVYPLVQRLGPGQRCHLGCGPTTEGTMRKRKTRLRQTLRLQLAGGIPLGQLGAT